MKIYYEFPDFIADLEDSVFSHLRSLNGLIPEQATDILIHLLTETSRDKYVNYYEMLKYKLMWDLRHIEEEIESESGYFKIEKEGR